MINGCVDEYTNLPVLDIEQEFSDMKHYEQLICLYSKVIMGIVAVLSLIIVYFFVKNITYDNREWDDEDDEYTKIEDEPN